MRWGVVALGLSLLTLLISCGGGSNTPSSRTLTGTWSVTVTSQAFNASGTATIQLQQNGNSVTGSASLTGTPCATSAPLTGTISGSDLSFQLSENGQVVTLTGTVNSSLTSMSGTYSAPSGGCTNGDFGTWSATKQS